MQNENKLKVIKNFYSNALKQALDENEISRSSFYHGFIEEEKLNSMYSDVREKILTLADAIIEIDSIDFISSLSKKEQLKIMTNKDGGLLLKENSFKLAQSSKKFKNTDTYLLLKRIETIEKILNELLESESN